MNYKQYTYKIIVQHDTYKIKINSSIKLIFLNKKLKSFLGVKYKIFVNKNFVFYILTTIIMLLFSFNLIINNAILVNFFFNYNFFNFF